MIELGEARLLSRITTDPIENPVTTRAPFREGNVLLTYGQKRDSDHYPLVVNLEPGLVVVSRLDEVPFNIVKVDLANSITREITEKREVLVAPLAHVVFERVSPNAHKWALKEGEIIPDRIKLMRDFVKIVGERVATKQKDAAKAATATDLIVPQPVI
jgi:hypothetical protein